MGYKTRPQQHQEQVGQEREKEKVYSPRYNNTAVKTDNINTQSGGLPERHEVHLSWPPIVTKNNNTKPIYCKCKVQGANGTNVHKSVMSVHTVVNKNTIRLLLNTREKRYTERKSVWIAVMSGWAGDLGSFFNEPRAPAASSSLVHSSLNPDLQQPQALRPKWRQRRCLPGEQNSPREKSTKEKVPEQCGWLL